MTEHHPTSTSTSNPNRRQFARSAVAAAVGATVGADAQASADTQAAPEPRKPHPYTVDPGPGPIPDPQERRGLLHLYEAVDAWREVLVAHDDDDCQCGFCVEWWWGKVLEVVLNAVDNCYVTYADDELGKLRTRALKKEAGVDLEVIRAYESRYGSLGLA